MAAGPSIDVTGWLEEQLAQASPDLLRAMVTTFAQALMGADADAVCGAGYGERIDERANTRNGYRRRERDTQAGNGVSDSVCRCAPDTVPLPPAPPSASSACGPCRLLPRIRSQPATGDRFVADALRVIRYGLPGRAIPDDEFLHAVIRDFG